MFGSHVRGVWEEVRKVEMMKRRKFRFLDGQKTRSVSKEKET